MRKTEQRRTEENRHIDSHAMRKTFYPWVTNRMTKCMGQSRLHENQRVDSVASYWVLLVPESLVIFGYENSSAYVVYKARKRRLVFTQLLQKKNVLIISRQQFNRLCSFSHRSDCFVTLVTDKFTKHGDACHQSGIEFIPLCVEALGG